MVKGRIRLFKPREWVVCRTEPRRERWAADNAAQQGFECYLPMIEEYQVVNGRKVVKTVPLFPGYLFVKMVNGRWMSLTGTYGVLDVVTTGTAPSRLENAFIEGLREQEKEGLLLLPKEKEMERYEPGEKVRLRSGPFSGYIGIFEGQKKEHRVSILLSILSSETSVEVDLNQIERP